MNPEQASVDPASLDLCLHTDGEQPIQRVQSMVINHSDGQTSPGAVLCFSNI